MTTEHELRQLLRQFWQDTQKKYGAEIRFGLDEADYERLEQLEQQLEDAAKLSQQNTAPSQSVLPSSAR